MRHGNQQKRTTPILPWVLMVIALLGMVTGGVVAYLSYSTPVVSNTFQADTDFNPIIEETMENNVKSEVAVSVSAEEDYAVYVRAAIVATWRRGSTEPEGQEILLAQAPVAGTDYAISLNLTETGWFEENGFYYYRSMVNPGEQTDDLINSCAPLVTKDGYVLNVEVMAQTIQALGTTDSGEIPAVTNAWGIEVNSEKKLIDPIP